MFWEGVWFLLASIAAFVATEHYIWHHPRYEFVFWLVAVTMFTCLLTLSPDSPLHYIISLELGPLSLTVFLGFLVPLFVSFILETSRVANLSTFEASNLPKATKVNHSARAKQATLDSLLDRLVYTSQARWFASWIRGTIEERQSRIHHIITEASSEELNHIFGSVNLPQLFTYGNFTSSITESWMKQESTISYIMEERISELGALPRAALLHSLMKMGALMFHKQQMEWVADLICGAKGDDLTVIKNFLDSGGDYNNFYKLVYVDVTDKDVRKRILVHVKKEGEKVRRLNAKTGHYGIKVLSDVDDTLWSSGGRWPAGCDSRYLGHVVYPGVLALFEELDMAQKYSQGPSKRISERSGISRRESKSSRRSTATASQKDADADLELSMELRKHNKLHKINTDGNFDEDMVSSTDDEEQAVVVLELPYEMGGGNVRLRVDVDDSIRVIQEKVQAKWRLPPWKQTLSVTTARGAGTGHSTGMERSQGGNLVFLSARPHAYKDYAENGSYRQFKKLYQDGRMHTTPTLLSGSMLSGMRAVLHGTLDGWKHRLHEVLEAGVALWDGGVEMINGRLNKANVNRHLRLKSMRITSFIDEMGEEVPRLDEEDDIIDDDSTVGSSSGSSSPSRHSSSRGSSSSRSKSPTKAAGKKPRHRRQSSTAKNHLSQRPAPETESVLSRIMSRISERETSRPKRLELATRSWEAVGRTKARSFKLYASLYPEYDFVFFGDNGQGDALMAEIVSEYPEFRERLRACFIHEVQNMRYTLSQFDPDIREKEWSKINVWKYQTYVGAAIKAHKLGLIPLRALHRIGVCAHEDLTELILQRPLYANWGQIVEELNVDIGLANTVLKKSSQDRTYLMTIPDVAMPHDLGLSFR